MIVFSAETAFTANPDVSTVTSSSPYVTQVTNKSKDHNLTTSQTTTVSSTSDFLGMFTTDEPKNTNVTRMENVYYTPSLPDFSSEDTSAIVPVNERKLQEFERMNEIMENYHPLSSKITKKEEAEKNADHFQIKFSFSPKSGIKKENNEPLLQDNKDNKEERVITRGELIASIVSAALGGILCSFIVFLSVFFILCKKGIISLSFSNIRAVHSLPLSEVESLSHRTVCQSQQQPKTVRTERQKKSEKNVNIYEKSHKKKDISENSYKIRRKNNKQRNKLESLTLNREMTWKARTCFVVDETTTSNMKKKSIWKSFFTKSTKVKKIKMQKRKKPYVQS